MKKKTMLIVLILFVVFVTGVTAQSVQQQANTLLQRYESLARTYENLANQSGSLAGEQHPTRQSLIRLETNRQNLMRQQSQMQADWRAFFTTDRDLTPAQQNRLNAIGDRILLADDRIGANIRTINSRL
jgi:hypothetical protein